MLTSATSARRRSKTAVACLAEVKRFERGGELFVAYDLARQALQKFPKDLALKHRAVLCLASTGATQRATEELFRLGLDPLPNISVATQLGLDVATLKPRLLKDAALAKSGAARIDALAKAAEAYEAVYTEAKRAGNKEAYYPGVNAATLNLLASNNEAASRLASEVLDLLSSWPGDQTFYEIASELEAHLVLSNLERAHQTIELVRTTVRTTALADYRGQATMLRQLRLIIEAKGLGPEWLQALAPPRVIHYLGHIIQPPGKPGRFPAEQERLVNKAIKKILDDEDVGFGYGSLAAGADILFAEALLKRKASLHIVLPFNRDEFIKESVQPAGENWVKRFEKCFRAAEKSGSVRYATEDRYLGDEHLFGYCSQLAMGLALLRAQHLSAPVEQIVVWDELPPSGPVGTAADVATWQRAGLPRKVIPVGNGFSPPPRSPEPAAVNGLERHPRAMLFSDIHGFSTLRDDQLQPFIEVILECCARVMGRRRKDILFANTWGDGLFLVFDDAGKAAACALELQEALGQVDLAANRFPPDMGLRVGLHLGPVYAARDPILKRKNFFGAHVSRTARVEPVTPEGCVYVTETMAAVLALHNADTFTCQYVGMTEAAKHYGQMRMFLLGRSAI
jgi:Adenylate and Guanylate cyclase catalytic domain